MTKPLYVQSAGVIRCCIQTIGAYEKEPGKWYTNEKYPDEGDEDHCDACGRKFKFHASDGYWRPED